MVYVVDSASFLSRRKGGNVGVSALVFLSPPSPTNLGLTRTFRVIFNMIYLIDITNNIGRIHALTISLFIL